VRVLITNTRLADRTGTELYVLDLAMALLERGLTPLAYSPVLGEVARQLGAAGVLVVDDLSAVTVPPDVIHGHHSLETMTALLAFPGVPAVSFCHSWRAWQDAPPRFPRILRYVGVDHTCADRLLVENGIPESQVRVILNFVDLARFRSRGPLPPRPQRALVFSNYATEQAPVAAVRRACQQAGITLDVLGAKWGNQATRPEDLLGGYDLIFAKARAALEALAVGAAVVVCDAGGVGPMVTTKNLDELRHLNFGVRALREPVSAGVLQHEIARYDAVDAAEVSRRIRASAGRDGAVDEIVALYEEVIAEHRRGPPDDPRAESRAAAAYVRSLTPRLVEGNLLKVFLKKAVRVPVLGLAIRSSLRGAAALGRRGGRFRDVLRALDGD
jgi:hypothetical protein